MSSSKVDTGMFNLLEETGDKKSSKMTFEDATEKIVIPTAMPIDEETPAVTATTLPSAPPAQSFAAAAPLASDRNVVVRAPATLPGGYKFDACVDDYIVPIEVVSSLVFILKCVESVAYWIPVYIDCVGTHLSSFF